MPSLQCVIPIVPAAQKRSRSRAFRNRAGNMVATNYKDPKQRAYEDTFRSLLLGKVPDGCPVRGPVSISVTAVMPVPKSWSKKRTIDAIEGRVAHTSKPDVDNLIKQMDCLTGTLWIDDAQIVSMTARKRYGQIPRWEISAEWEE